MLCKYYLEVGKKTFYENNKNMLPYFYVCIRKLY